MSTPANKHGPATVKQASTLDDLIATTQERLISLIRQTCEDRPTVHLGLCNYLNMGDVALNVAERRLLRRANAHVTRVTLSGQPNPPANSISSCAALVVKGGGNIGDLYPSELAFRVAAIRDNPQAAILQMPQSIHFRSLRKSDDYRAAVARAKRYVLLTRDHQSYDWARRHLDCRVEIVPDAALSLGRLDRPVAPSKPVIALIRSDCESAGGRAAIPPDVPMVDWPQEKRFRHDLSQWARWLIDFTAERRLNLPTRLYDPLIHGVSNNRLRRTLPILSQGHYVITDRLHGHILCSLLGIPQVVMDNSYGKVWGFMDTWHMDSLVPTVRADALSADGVVSALERLSALPARGPSRYAGSGRPDPVHPAWPDAHSSTSAPRTVR